jgi:hypothetical protein
LRAPTAHKTTRKRANLLMIFHETVKTAEFLVDFHGGDVIRHERARNCAERTYQFRTSRTFLACRLLTMNSCPLLRVTSQRWLLSMLILRICSTFTSALR